MSSVIWDVAVIGAGPAGSAAAAAAAESGARVLILERQHLPRYKLCGGGLIGLSLQALPVGFEPPVRNLARQATFTFDLDQQTTREEQNTIIPMVMRDDLDLALVNHAVAQGAHLQAGTRVDRIEAAGDQVRLDTSSGEVRTRCLVGADGSASLAARVVGARYRQVDLGMEVEVQADEVRRRDWQGRVLIDFGRVRGGYGWVFPKGERLTVGVIAAKGLIDLERQYLADLIQAHGLTDLPIVHQGGHLTRCRAADSPLASGRILLAGDAAGLLEPWTREGISFALRSGSLAGRTAAQMAATQVDAQVARAGADYAQQVADGMGAEMRVGFTALAAYERHPKTFYRALASDPGWNAFVRLARGETTLARAGRHRVVRTALTALTALGGR
jgi:geranylgeranyl reductase family protein